MFNKLFTKGKKAVLFATFSLVTLVAATSAINNSQDSQQFMVQGASKTTMTELVEQVGGEVIHNFDEIAAISANLTEEQAFALYNKNPLIRLSNPNETAGILWGKRRGTERFAGILWGKRRGTER